ncbi:MAG: chromosomal replication initiator protein DnaA [Spirochaetes bacterium]|nr:chromosomal replication initiator protein DnaA [Spirochaetota bacterium]
MSEMVKDKIFSDLINYMISKNIIDEFSYNVWFNNIEFEKNGEEFILYFPSIISKDKFEKEFFICFYENLKEIINKDPKIKLQVKEKKVSSDLKEKININLKENNLGKNLDEKVKNLINEIGVKEDNNKKNDRESILNYNQAFHLNPKYTFDNFVIGNNNKFCAAAALRVAKFPGQNFNPLFIYGSVGLGKTHILQAIAHYIIEHFPDLKVVYIPVDQFVNEFIYSLQNKQMEFFRLKYRKADILLLDDIQFLEKKDASMEEFFHTFNILHQAGKQMVFTCDRPPKDLQDFEERVRNRMEWGLTVKIVSPDFETRVAILNKKASIEGRKFSNELIHYIAKNVKSSIRDLESALIKIIAYCDIFAVDTSEINPEKASEILKDQLKYVDDKKVIVIDDIIRKVAESFKVSTVDIKSKKRNQSIALARNVAMYLARELTNYSTTEIGLSFGGKDHSTILHAYSKIDSLIKEDSVLRITVETIKKELLS